MEKQSGRIAARKTTSNASTLPEVGKVKIGEKATNAAGVEYPRAIDYFRPTGSYANEFTKVFGAKPNRLSVAFVSDDLNEVCNQRFECWDGGKRWGWGDGEYFMVWDKAANGGKGEYVPNLPSTDIRVKSLKWDEMLTLRFVILELRGIMGYWSFQTKAKAVSIPAIVKSFDFVREKAGSIIGFPFNLIVEKKIGYNPGEAKSYPVVSLVPNFSEDAIEQVRQYIDMGGNLNRLTSKMIQQERVLENVTKPLEIGDGKNLQNQK